MKKLRLSIELIPRTTWYRNLRTMLPEKWQAISRKIRENANGRCEICGRQVGFSGLEAHEVWKYNKKKHTQKLHHIQALCRDCHMVKHIGFASANGKKSEARKWMMKVNGISKKKAKKYIKAAISKNIRRSMVGWKVKVNRKYIRDVLNDAVI